MSAETALIRLRRVDAAVFLVLAAAAALGALHFLGRGTTSGVIGCSLIAFLLATSTFVLGGEAPCPDCGAMVTGLPLVPGLKPYVYCPKCRRYAAWEGGRLRALEDDHLAPRAEFAVPVDQVRELPTSCCVCQRPACRYQDLVYTAAMRTKPGFPTGKPVNFKVGAPYCDKHFDEARLAFEDLSNFPGISAQMLVETTKLDEHFVLKVRSYGFYRAAARVS